MHASTTESRLSHLDRPLIWAGFRQMVPLSLFVIVFGAAFGLAATQTGLGTWGALFMSATVFAGAAQFAVLDLWGAQVPVPPLALTVFAINARHLLMGATLFPWLQHLPLSRRYGAMVLASDSNWALSMQAFGRGQPGLGVLVGGGLALWVAWMLGTWLGIAFGGAVPDPRRWGLDMVMACFLMAMVVGGPKNARMGLIWTVAATASLLAHRYLPENSHVVAGALAGGVLGLLWPEDAHVA
jgi:predicted branched-subunit amino acid permease